jgi:hypothetical protein
LAWLPPPTLPPPPTKIWTCNQQQKRLIYSRIAAAVLKHQFPLVLLIAFLALSDWRGNKKTLKSRRAGGRTSELALRFACTGPQMGSGNTTTVQEVDVERFCDTKGALWLFTGDLLLLRGCGLRSLLVQLLTVCRFSHVAMAVRLKDLFPTYAGPDELWLFESVFSPGSVPCVCGKTHNGVRLVPLRQRLLEYVRESGAGDVSACVIQAVHQGDPPTAATPFCGLRPADAASLVQFMRSHLHCQYDSSIKDSIDAFLGPELAFGHMFQQGPADRRAASAAAPVSTHAYTCSSMVAAFYVYIDTLSPTLELSSVSPKTFLIRDTALAPFARIPSARKNITVFGDKNHYLRITYTSTDTQLEEQTRRSQQPIDAGVSPSSSSATTTAAAAAVAAAQHATSAAAATVAPSESAALVADVDLELDI